MEIQGPGVKITKFLFNHSWELMATDQYAFITLYEAGPDMERLLLFSCTNLHIILFTQETNIKENICLSEKSAGGKVTK